MGEDTSNQQGADMKLVEEGDHEMGDEKGEVMGRVPVPVREREQTRRDAGGELVGVVVAEGNVQTEEAGSDHIHRVDSSRMEGDHNCHTDSGEVEDHRWQGDRVVEYDNDAKEVAVVAQRAHTNNFHDDRTECDQRVVGSVKSG
jgi:hypothetical protein